MVVKDEILVIKCPGCRGAMGAVVKGFVTEPGDEMGSGPWKVSLAQCPKCKGALVGVQESSPDGLQDAERVWPQPGLRLHSGIPWKIQRSLREAYGCLEGNNYTASVAMSGRALEGMVRHLTNPTMGLQNGIRELHKQGTIDDRLNQWAEALHLERNAAAHFSGDTFSQQDAEDNFKFTNNICEYVFVLSKEFEEFKKRKAKKP